MIIMISHFSAFLEQYSPAINAYKELLQYHISYLEHNSYGDDTRGMVALGRYNLDPAKVTEEKGRNKGISHNRDNPLEYIEDRSDQG